MPKAKSREVALILHDIRSTHNVGAIFRTADAAGVSKIYLTGITPTPQDRFGRKRQDVAKASLGAEQSVAWEYHQLPTAVIKELKQIGFQVIALEQGSKPSLPTPQGIKSCRSDLSTRCQEHRALTQPSMAGLKGLGKSTDYKKIKPKYPVAIIVGNEVTGISSQLLKLADVVAEIPMKGKKESLNVSVALGVALFRILNL